MIKVGKVDYFDGSKRALYFFVGDDVEEEGFYKVETQDKVFYVFVNNLSEMPLDKDMRARYSQHNYSFDNEERYLLYAQATVLQEYRKGDGKKIIGYKTIPRHNDEVYKLEAKDFEILGLPKLDFAHVRSGSEHFETTAGFKKNAYITHWLLCGWTNSGKTNSAKVLLNVTLKGDGEPFAGGVIIDPHGEYYDSLKHFNQVGAPMVFHYKRGAGSDPNEKELLVSTKNIYPSYLREIYDFKEDTQVSVMSQACREKGRDWVKFILENDAEVIDAGLQGNAPGRVMSIGAVKSRMGSIFNDDRDVWAHENTRFLQEILDGVSRGNWYVIDVSSVGNKTTKVLTAMVARSIFAKYKRACTKNREEWKKMKPAGLLVEEAHNYLSPEETSRGNIIAKIAKEGRKFNVFTIIVEQDPSGIDPRILKQVHNKIILQLIPKDARAICETTPYVNELEKKIPYYSIGEGVFVSTGSFNFALPVRFPKVEDWIAANSTPCSKCGKPTTAKTGACAACQTVQRKQDASAFM